VPVVVRGFSFVLSRWCWSAYPPRYPPPHFPTANRYPRRFSRAWPDQRLPRL